MDYEVIDRFREVLERLAALESKFPRTASREGLAGHVHAAQDHASRHGKGQPDDLANQNIAVRTLQVKDIDPTPIADILLTVVDSILRVRDTTDAAYRSMHLDLLRAEGGVSATAYGPRTGDQVVYDGVTQRVRQPQVGGDPASLVDGDLWYNTVTNKLRIREAGVSKDVVGGGGGVDPEDLWSIDGVMGV